MPKNTGKGGKAFRSGKGDNQQTNRELTLVEDELEAYAMILRPLGCHRMECQLADGSKATGVVRGIFIRKVIMTTGDVVLVSKRDFQPGTVDIIHKYKQEEVKELVKDGHIPREFRSSEEQHKSEANPHFEFARSAADQELISELEGQKESGGCKLVSSDPLAGMDADFDTL